MGRRSGRAAAKRAAEKLESTPRAFDDENDEDMPDVDDEELPEPEDQADGDDVEDQDEADEQEDQEDVEDEEAAPKSPSPPPQPVIRKRRLGRPPKNRPPDWDQLPIERPVRDPNETPRKRGRGGYRGRGGRKGQALVATQQAIDKDGTMADIANDELVLPEDAEGETKVDKLGRLQGDRDYRCRVFTVIGRGDRLYMLSTEPARCVGFRDSYLFFTKHKKLYKIIVDDEEKRDMIERDIIPHSYKGRSIGIVTARSVFREFGSLIIIGGRRITDDYEVAEMRKEGAVEGELADPTDQYVPGEPYNKNQYVAWHGASQVYHTGAPSIPMQPGKPESKKRRVTVTDSNWQLEHARAAAQFNAEIGHLRRQNTANGVYDINTNMMHYPANMQPTHARIVQVDDSSAASQDSGLFPPVDPRVARNFRVIDYIMETSPMGMSYKADKDVPEFLREFNGLGAMSDEIKDLLPPACRTAFDEALQKENDWKAKWGPEAETAHRRELIIDANIVPYTKHPNP